MNLRILLNSMEDVSLSAYKIIKLKKNIVKRIIQDGEATIAELSKETNFSVPTVTKAIGELAEEGIVLNVGESRLAGGRNAKRFGVNPDAGYYLGVEVNRDSVNIGIQDFTNRFIYHEESILYKLENKKESLDSLCLIINNAIHNSKISSEKIIGAIVTLSGRIDSRKGYSYNYFFFEEKPLTEIIESKIHIKTFLENDSRAMAYGEYNCGVVNKEKNVIFVNLCWGVGTAIINNGNLIYGHSGFAGEFGHSPVFNNEIICHCGKKGCLETEISGFALERKFKEALKKGSKSILSLSKEMEDITLYDVLQAIKAEDVLAIEITHEIGYKLGRYLSILVNIFNPELVILGGILAETRNHIQLPVKSALQKYSLRLVNQDMELKMSALGSKAGLCGACYILRDRFLNVIN